MTDVEALPLATAPAEIHGPATGESRNPFALGNFRRWWMASILGGTGVGIQTVTVPLFIRDRVSDDHRAAVIALALICQNLPAAFFGLLGGVAADRVERRRILVRTYGVAALVSLGYVLLSGGGASVVWPAFVFSAVVGSAGAFTNPARQSMVPQIVPRSMIQNATIFGTMAFMATLQFAGPTAGGVLADLGGLTFAFSTEVVMLVGAALLFSRIATDRPVPTGRNVWRDLLDGLHYMRAQTTVLGILALGTIPGVLIMGPFVVNNVILVQDVFHRSDAFVGAMMGAFGAGVLAGSIVLATRRPRRRGLLLILCVCTGGGLMLLAVLPSVWPALALIFVMGALGPAIFINFAVALIQEVTDPKMMGRVMSMYGLAFSIATPFGFAQAGIVSSAFGPQVSLFSSGALCLALGLVALALLRNVRELR